MKADLHIHTTESDGTWNPRQIGREAQKRGLDIIAVTDHDTVSGVIPAQEAAPPGVELIPVLKSVQVLVTAMKCTFLAIGSIRRALLSWSTLRECTLSA